MKIIIVILMMAIQLPAIADGRRHPEPVPPVQSAPPSCSCWWQPVLAGAAAAAIIGIPIYINRDKEGKETGRVEVVPTGDGKGTILTIKVTH